MRKLLVALFIMLIVGIGILGYTQTTNKSEEIIEETNQSVVVQQVE